VEAIAKSTVKEGRSHSRQWKPGRSLAVLMRFHWLVEVRESLVQVND